MSNVEIAYYVFGFLTGCVFSEWVGTGRKLKRLENLMQKQAEEEKKLQKQAQDSRIRAEDYRQNLLTGLESISIDNFKSRKNFER